MKRGELGDLHCLPSYLIQVPFSHSRLGNVNRGGKDAEFGLLAVEICSSTGSGGSVERGEGIVVGGGLGG